MATGNSIGSGQALDSSSSPTFTSLTLGGTYKNSALPCFFAYSNSAATSVTGDGTTYTGVFGTEMFDLANNFDGTSTFTAPISGKYLFIVDISLGNLGASHTIGYASVVLTSSSQEFWNVSPANCRDASNNLTFSGIVGPITMAQGDTAIVQVTVSNSTKTVNFAGSALGGRQCVFSGFLVC